jgi:hypothetical protein
VPTGSNDFQRWIRNTGNPEYCAGNFELVFALKTKILGNILAEGSTHHIRSGSGGRQHSLHAQCGHLRPGSGSESGSIGQRHGSAEPDLDPDPHQNAMDPQHWKPRIWYR